MPSKPDEVDGRGDGLDAGVKVKVQGLKARPDLNGCVAILESFNAESGRWNIKLDAGKGDRLLAFALKPEALSPLPEEDERSVNVKADGSCFGFDCITLKLTISERQLKKPLATAVIAPFLKAYAQRAAGGRLFGPDDIESVRCDGVTLSDYSIPCSVVLMKHTTVGLEISFVPPPPPPPLLHKEVALTGLDTTAYKEEHNGKWGRVLDFDASRGLYSVAVTGDRRVQLQLPPEKLIEIVRHVHHHSEDDLDEFGPPKHAPPTTVRPGTTAFDVWMRSAPRRARQAEEQQASKLAARAFALVPFSEKCCHVDAQLDVLRRRIDLNREILSRDIELFHSNAKLDACWTDSKQVRGGRSNELSRGRQRPPPCLRTRTIARDHPHT